MQLLDFKKNYFDLFDMNVTFEVDKKALHERQQRLQSLFHPDRFVNADEQEKRLSVQQAAWVNEAYQTLENPVKRARYMLEVSGLELNDDTETTSDSAFLMDQMALREQLDACRDHEDPLSQCDQIELSLKGREQQLSDEFIEIFESGDLDAARIVSRKMLFIQRIQEQVAELQFELEEELG